MKYNLKKVITYTAQEKHTYEGTKTWYMSKEERFDLKGNLLEEIEYDGQGAVDRRVVYRYSAQEQLVANLVYGEGGQLLEANSYQRDTTGELLEWRKQYEDGGLSVYRYFKAHKRMEVQIFNEEEVLEGRQLSLFDDEDKLLEEQVYDGEGTLKERHEYRYNTQGWLVEQKEWEADRSYIISYTYRYDAEGRLVKKTSKNAQGHRLELHVFDYDDESRLIKETLNGMTTFFTYNEEGLCIKEMQVNSEGRLESQRLMHYNRFGSLLRASYYQAGDAYELEPQVIGRTQATHLHMKWEYEYYQLSPSASKSDSSRS